MRTWLRKLVLLGFMSSFVNGVEAATILRWGDVLSADHPSVQMIGRVANRVKDATQGRVEIQAYPAGQLGSSKDQIEAVALARALSREPFYS